MEDKLSANHGKRPSFSIFFSLCGLILFLAGIFGCLWLERGTLGGRLVILFLFLIFGGLGVYLLRRARLPLLHFSLCLLVLGAAVVVRVMSLEHATGDYNDFLAPWTAFFRENGGFLGLKESVGNYNVPYLYFLAAFSYLPVPDLYLIKLLSIFFDLLLAYAGLRLARQVFGRDGACAAAFSLLLLLPTVVLNGGLWGQCDSIYTALVLLSLADALEDRPGRSVVWLGVAFSFKLQAVFLIPLWCVLWYSRRVKFRHLCLFPVSYFVTILPALLLGKPLMDILGVYWDQTGQYNEYLTLNAPSVYALIPYGKAVDVAFWSKLGVLAAFLLVLGLLVWLFFFRARLTADHILTAGLILAIGVPLLLPHMHERYFMLAETLSVVWCLGAPRRIPAAAAVQVAALGGYHAYLVLRYAFPMAWGAWLLIAALAACILSLALSLRKPKAAEAVPAVSPPQAPEDHMK